MSCFLKSYCKSCATGGAWTDPSGGSSRAIKSTTLSAGPPLRRRARRRVGVAVFPNRLHFIPCGTIPSSGLSRVIVCQALFPRNLARNTRHSPRNAYQRDAGAHGDPFHHFFDDRTGAAARDTLIRGRLARWSTRKPRLVIDSTTSC